MRHEAQWLPWVLLLPSLLLLSIFLVFPMGVLLLNSFTVYQPGVGEIEGTFTLDNYWRFIGDGFYWGILGRTLRISFEATVASLLLAFPVALCITRLTGVKRAILTAVVLAPLLINVLVRALGWFVVLGREGLVVQLFGLLVDNPPVLLYTEACVVIGLVQVFVPLMVLCLLSSLLQIDPALPRAAKDLGANDREVFSRITVPLTLPGIAAGSVLTFALCCGTFAIPALVGGARTRVMAFVAYENQIDLLNWPFGAVVTIVLLLVVSAIVAIYQFGLRRYGLGQHFAET